MDKQTILTTIKKVKENSHKRNFNQTVDFIINLKEIDVKKQEHNINSFITLNHPIGKKVKVCALVSHGLATKAKEVVDKVITDIEFEKQSKKDIKKLAREYDYFIAEATIISKVANTFGKILGPKGKMPNPNAGCIINPATNIKSIYDKLQKTIHLQTKNEPIIKCVVGTEKMSDEEIVDNTLTVYNNILSLLPQEKSNINSLILKLTMSQPFEIEGK